MMDTNIYNALIKVMDTSRILLEEPLASYTTFKVGGKADCLILPANCRELAAVINILRDLKQEYIVLGGCSNVLISDRGIRGVVIKMDKEVLKGLTQTEGLFTAEAGVQLADLAKLSIMNGYAGMEFAVGIPGSVGGAVFMNAGAYGGEMSDVIYSVDAVMPNGKVKTFNSEECRFLYRKSIFQSNGAIVYRVTVKLAKCNDTELGRVKAKADEYTKKRESKQPLEWASAGSTFKRPEGFFVGPLIEKAGLKGYSLGGAQVSEKHAGFIINRGTATAQDILQLIQFVREKVQETSGIWLEPEVRILGE